MYKDKLKTSVNNKIIFTNLNLSKDEYVTNFELRFGKVKAGFRKIEGSKGCCDMLPTIGNGILFTNKTK